LRKNSIADEIDFKDEVSGMGEFDEKYRKRFMALSTTNVSDALDTLGLKGATYGIRPMTPGWGKVTGRAVTLKMTAAGPIKGKTHLGVKAIDFAEPGDIIVIDNGGRLDTSCWGGILANGAQMKGISAVVIDGACRDLDECLEIDFPVFARGTVVATARGRVMEENTNVMIQFGGVQVNPGDIVMADRSGVVIVPWDQAESVLAEAEHLFDKEGNMVRDIRAGHSMIEVDQKYNYEQMLSRK
jgi:regulator of RNase E activity RraA